MWQPRIHYIVNFYLVVLLLHSRILIRTGASILEDSSIDGLVKRGCTQKIGECHEKEGVEISTRRVLLLQKRYISYETLTRDMIPCARPGASYYACHAGEANAYNRGCEIITRCARG